SQKITIDPEVSMLALGDSYTIGQSVPVNERWPHQLIDLLRDKGVVAEYPDYIATTGWTTKNLLQGIETKLNSEKAYNLVSILIGVNNQYQGLDISLYEPDLRTIINKALEIVGNDTSRIFILSIPDYAYTPFGSGLNSITAGINAYNAINKRLAGEYNIIYVDITPISRLGTINPDLVAYDGLHPSGLQYTLWVDDILPYLELSQSVQVESKYIPLQEDGWKLQVFPNPAKSGIQISSDKNPDSLQIWNIQGMQLAEINNPVMPLHLDISEFSPGVYILKGIASGEENTIRFVVR
ncbi:MAG: T9SS type A sorting domain-containing protein, partial [Bacteroidales bacterium]|nr:T9SS type A sorting domain-containing protein [Bacteroidales bacterium]